ncbi:MAG: SPOR domain-containing protein [Dokdonia sp.]|nr:SPOR domain-containing protein [Dokdonia sp.]
MQLDQYISDLLYRYECVILPGFGAFLTQHQSAQVHATTHAFYPPKKRLSFNAQLVDTDGLLANYIAKTEQLPHEDANLQIATYVRFLFDRLHKGEQVTFKNIGQVAFNSENHLTFEPSYHLNYLSDSFGLSTFTTPKVAREVYKKEVEALEAKTPIAFTSEKRTGGWIKYAAAAVVLFGLAGFASYNYLEQVEDHNYAAEQEADQKLESKIQEATFVITNPLPAVTLNLLKPHGRYHVVAGAFRNEENAAKRVSQLRAKGYKARQIGTNRFGLHQVVYESYSDSQAALQALRSIRKDDNKTAWLLNLDVN